MKKLFVISVIFLIIGVGSLGVAFYLYKMQGQGEPVVGAGISGGAAGEKAVTRVVYEKPETVDRSTPDKALQSYWEYSDYVRSKKREPKIKGYIKGKKAFDEYMREIAPIEEPLLNAFLSGEAFQSRREKMGQIRPRLFTFFPERDPREEIQKKYRRHIEKVELETDTRAKVACTIYNVTPLENLKQSLTEEQENYRKRGKDIVYTMEKFQDGWKIIDKKWTVLPGLFNTDRSVYELPVCNYLWVGGDDN